MVVGHHLKKENVVMDILIEYNVELKEPEELISIIVMDLNDGSEIELTNLLYRKFPSIIKFMVDSIDWDKVYQNSVANVLK